MKAIDTFYNGHYFRSRLEARWAVFFDKLRIKYEYEVEGFESPKGERYLPDFYLPETYLRDGCETGRGVYIEIKPGNFKKSYLNCSEWFDKPLILFTGNPYDQIWGAWGVDDSGYQITPWWDNCMKVWVCRSCRTSKIEFSEGNYNCCPDCGGAADENKLRKAAIQAQSARFEFDAII